MALHLRLVLDPPEVSREVAASEFFPAPVAVVCAMFALPAVAGCALLLAYCFSGLAGIAHFLSKCANRLFAARRIAA